MPLDISKFTRADAFKKPKIDYADLVRIEREGPEPGDWGFDLDLPYEQLSVFARHIDTAAPVTRLPLFAIAEWSLPDKSRAALAAGDRQAHPPFSKVPLGVIGTDHVGSGSFDLWPLRHL